MTEFVETSAPSESNDPVTTSNGNVANHSQQTQSGGRNFDALVSGNNSGEQSLQEAIDESGATTKAEIAEAARKWRLKVNGEEHEFEEDEVKALAQKGYASDKKFQEAANKERQLQQLVMAMKTNPAVMFKELGLDPRGWAEQYLARDVEERLLTPEERQARKDAEELKRYRDMQKQHAEEAQKHQMKEIRAKKEAEITQGIVEAMAKTDLPNDPQVRNQILLDALKFYAADRAKAYSTGTDPTMTPERAIKRARDSYTRGLTDILSRMSGESILKWLGEDTIKKIRAEDLKRVKQAPTNKPSAGTGVSKPVQQADSRKPMSEREWREHLRRGGN